MGRHLQAGAHRLDLVVQLGPFFYRFPDRLQPPFTARLGPGRRALRHDLHSIGQRRGDANAGPDQGSFVGDLVELDGSASSDPELDALTFSWSFSSRPAGSAAALAASDGPRPYFTPDAPGEYVVALVVNDGFGPSVPDGVSIQVVSASDYAAGQTAQALTAIGVLEPGHVTTSGNQKALSNFATQALKHLGTGNVTLARERLTMALERTDGCVLRGRPDPAGGGVEVQAQDYVTDCAAQAAIHGLLSVALFALGS